MQTSNYSLTELLLMVEEEVQRSRPNRITSASDVYRVLHEYASKDQQYFLLLTLDGAGISSITFTGATTADKSKLVIDDANALVEAGFFKKVVDTDMVAQYFTSEKYGHIIQEYAHIEVESIPKPAKIKINKRRSSANNLKHTEIVEVVA